jgi:hypothetical protein
MERLDWVIAFGLPRPKLGNRNVSGRNRGTRNRRSGFKTLITFSDEDLLFWYS